MSNLTGMVVIPFCTVISAGSANASASSREISNDVFCCLSFDSAANVGKGTINEQITKIAQNHPAIVKTSSSEAPCWISR